VQLKTLLGINASWVDAATPTGWTPLMYASYHGHEQCVELLLKSGR
jgi:ankyrin repeat protein